MCITAFRLASLKNVSFKNAVFVTVCALLHFRPSFFAAAALTHTSVTKQSALFNLLLFCVQFDF